MLEVLVLLCTVALLISCSTGLGFANPFQIYFLVWFADFFALWTSRGTYIPISDETLMLMLVAKAAGAAVLLGVLATRGRSEPAVFRVVSYEFNDKLIWIALAVIAAGAPLSYQRAVEMAGADIFTVLGYVSLRNALTLRGEDYGLLGYLTIPCFVIASICVAQCSLHRKGFLRALVALPLALFYTYLSTGRTFVLLLLIMIFAPLVLLRKIGVGGVIGAMLLVVGLFLFVAGMTSKGVSIEDSFAENVEASLELLRAYTVAPLLALSRFLEEQQVADWGANTFRFVYAALFRLGLSDIPPVALVRDFVYVPDQTNVFTVYDVYLADFSYPGIVIPPLFLIAHWYVYRRAVTNGGLPVFYCAASFFPLVMQFFQDVYVSLVSQWVQLAFWYWLFVAARVPRWLAKVSASAPRGGVRGNKLG